MTKYAETTPDKTAIVRFPISLREAFALFPPNTSPVDDPSTETFANVPVVPVEETVRPTLAFGETSTSSVINDAGTWRERWTVVPADAPTVKAHLRQMARSILDDKIERLSPAELALFAELGRYELAGASPNIALFPLLSAVRTFRGGSIAQTITFVQGLRNPWTTRVAQYIPRYLDVIGRIQAASTAAEAKAIYDELEALS